MQSIISMFLVTRSLSSFEALNVFVSSLSDMQILRSSLMMSVSPLYLLVLKYWTKIWGNSEISLRSLSLIFASVTIIFIHHILIEVFKKDEKKSYRDLLFFILNPLFLILSFQVSALMMYLCLVVISFYFFLKKRYGFYVIASSLAILTDDSFIFMIAIQGLYFVSLKKNSFSKFLKLVAPVLVLNILIMGMFLLQNHVDVVQNGFSRLLYVLGSLIASSIVLFVANNGSKFTKMVTVISVGVLLIVFIFHQTEKKEIDMKATIFDIKAISSKSDKVYLGEPILYFQAIYYYRKPVYVYLKDRVVNMPYSLLIPESRYAVKIPDYPNKAFYINKSGEFEALASY